jgi:hypothetical protein
LAEDNPNPRASQDPNVRIEQIQELILDLRGLHLETKHDPAAEQRRTELFESALYLLECNKILAKLKG